MYQPYSTTKALWCNMILLMFENFENCYLSEGWKTWQDRVGKLKYIRFVYLFSNFVDFVIMFMIN